jgi:predicted dehydrogenase
MVSRRSFLQATAVAAVARPVFSAQAGVQGANDRVRLGVIGTGTRGTMLARFFSLHDDCELVAACDVAGSRLDEFMKVQSEAGAKVDRYDDYRRILDRQDVDAVVVATPDHWHGPMTVEACTAGKDVYVEKPISNAIEPAQQMVAAARQHDRVVQVGLQQRQGEHFQEGAKLVQDGLLGNVTHCVMKFGGGYTTPPGPVIEPPADLDWEKWQGPAPRHPYRFTRQRRWRTYYDYGGGLVTDWGVHLVDVAHMYLGLDTKAPRLASASAQYVNVEVPERDQVPDAFIVSWQYDDVVMSFTNAITNDPGFGSQGTYFFGPEGSLQVHRNGFKILPGRPRRRPEPGQSPPIDTRVRRFREDYQNDPHTIEHCRDFLDCIKSRKRPVGDIEIGFYSTLPCLLALLAIREGRTFAWDGTAAKPA